MYEDHANSLTQEIKRRYENVLGRIAETAKNCDRDINEIRLVVVTKTKSPEVVKAVINAGCKLLGENYVADALEKIHSINDKNISWHMIGHVQSRKARQVCENFDWVHSLDRIKIANLLNRYMAGQGRRLPVLLECNISGEESKHGFPAWNKNKWIDLQGRIEDILKLPHLDVRGLMTIPPWTPDPEASRPYYRKLRELGSYFAEAFPQLKWNEYSMGMSNDFEVAIEEGATIVRIGTAIVGPR